MKFAISTKKNLDRLVPLTGAAVMGYYVFIRRDNLRQAVILALAVGIALWVLTRSITGALLDTLTDKLPDTKAAEIQQQYGVSKAQYDSADNIASRVYKAFHASAWTEDETAAIEAMNSSGSAQMVKLVCAIYRAKYGDSLKGAFDENVGFSDYWVTPIDSLVENNWY